MSNLDENTFEYEMKTLFYPFYKDFINIRKIYNNLLITL